MFPEKFENPAVTGYFGFLFEENSGRENTWLRYTPSFPKSSIFKMFPSTPKSKTGLSDVFGQGLRYWQMRTGVVSPKTIESIERFQKFVYGVNELNLHTKRRKRG